MVSLLLLVMPYIISIGAAFLELNVQWNPSNADTTGTKNFVCCSEVSLAQGLVVDHAGPTIAASYDN